MKDVGPHYESILLDVTGVSLEWLRAHGGSTLSYAVTRALDEQLDRPSPVAAFNNAMSFVDTTAPDDL